MIWIQKLTNNQFHGFQLTSKLKFDTFDNKLSVLFLLHTTVFISHRYGAMGLLKTSSDWRGEGCAKACINNLAFHMESLGIVPYVYIEDWNVGSISLFEKLGFVKTHDASWICCLPKQHQLGVET